MEQKQNRIAREAAADAHRDSHFSPPADENHRPPDEKTTVPPAIVSSGTGPTPVDVAAFDPVPLRYREDGLTPQRQREFVEALADCGVARQAAALIGVSEQAIARVRRRADARAFDLACEAAQRVGARRLRSVAYERAIEGTVKRHYYHGELKSEELVYDNRLLIYLLGKTEHLVEPRSQAQAVLDDWEPWMEAVEQGLAEPPVQPEPEPEPEADPEEPLGDEVWQADDGAWWTNFPPPVGFVGEEEWEPHHIFYCRTLTDAERAVVEAEHFHAHSEQLALEAKRRDRFFGFPGGSRGAEISSSREAETCETSEPSGTAASAPETGRRGARRPATGKRKRSAAAGPGPAVGEAAPGEGRPSAPDEHAGGPRIRAL